MSPSRSSLGSGGGRAGGLEGRLVVRAAVAPGRRRRGAPRVVGAASRAPTATAAAVPAPAEVPAATAAGDLVDLGGRVPQRGADLVDLQLDDGPLLALLRLEGALLEPAGHHHPGAPGQRLGHVL